MNNNPNTTKTLTTNHLPYLIQSPWTPEHFWTFYPQKPYNKKHQQWGTNVEPQHKNITGNIPTYTLWNLHFTIFFTQRAQRRSPMITENLSNFEAITSSPSGKRVRSRAGTECIMTIMTSCNTLCVFCKSTWYPTCFFFGLVKDGERHWKLLNCSIFMKLD